jgi:hypothetical protein
MTVRENQREIRIIQPPPWDMTLEASIYSKPMRDPAGEVSLPVCIRARLRFASLATVPVVSGSRRPTYFHNSVRDSWTFGQSAIASKKQNP